MIVQLGGASPMGSYLFPLMSKGERFIRCMDRELDDWRESTEGCFQGE
jgi:hypothetical protein